MQPVARWDKRWWWTQITSMAARKRFRRSIAVPCTYGDVVQADVKYNYQCQKTQYQVTTQTCHKTLTVQANTVPGCTPGAVYRPGDRRSMSALLRLSSVGLLLPERLLPRTLYDVPRNNDRVHGLWLGQHRWYAGYQHWADPWVIQYEHRGRVLLPDVLQPDLWGNIRHDGLLAPTTLAKARPITGQRISRCRRKPLSRTSECPSAPR